MSVKLIEHHIALPGAQLPPVDETKLLDYVVGANGIYARGRRPGLEVCMPVSFSLSPVRGLRNLESYVQWGWPKADAGLVELMIAASRGVCANEPLEALFHLSFGEVHTCANHLRCGDGWHLVWPEQRATAESVIPVDTSAGAEAIIEVHSHHSMRPDFSPDDNRDEAQGFRVYAVIGEIFTAPKIRARVGLFGHFFDFSAAEFFDLPDELRDCNAENL